MTPPNQQATISRSTKPVTPSSPCARRKETTRQPRKRKYWHQGQHDVEESPPVSPASAAGTKPAGGLIQAWGFLQPWQSRARAKRVRAAARLFRPGKMGQRHKERCGQKDHASCQRRLQSSGQPRGTASTRPKAEQRARKTRKGKSRGPKLGPAMAMRLCMPARYQWYTGQWARPGAAGVTTALSGWSG